MIDLSSGTRSSMADAKEVKQSGEHQRPVMASMVGRTSILIWVQCVAKGPLQAHNRATIHDNGRGVPSTYRREHQGGTILSHLQIEQRHVVALISHVISTVAVRARPCFQLQSRDSNQFTPATVLRSRPVGVFVVRAGRPQRS